VASVVRHAEIAGGGIAGFSIASQLAEAGWSVRVHERFDAIREVGAAIAVGQNGVDALRRIGAFENAIVGGTKLDYWSIEDQWGRIVHADNVTTDLYSVPRSSLQGALHRRALDLGVEVWTNSQAIGYQNNALVLQDGTALPADLVVGADGVWSRVRASLAEQGMRVQQIDLKVAGLRAILPRMPDDPEDRMLEWLSGQRRVGVLPLDEENVAIYMFCPTSDEVGRRLPLDVDSWSDSYPHLRSAFERVPPDAGWRDVIEMHCSSWVHGNAVLLGDAAFGMAPNLGQGGCTAMQAAVSLSAAVANADDVAAALQTWEQQERPHVDYVQKWSGRYSRWCSKSPALALPLRSWLFGVWSRSDRLNKRFAGVESRLLTSR
jgi:2-polyprenyl-6-methoxyphenol hydroxylase-like FAD-dependent oxidoreductase